MIEIVLKFSSVFIGNQHIQCIWSFTQNLTFKYDQDTHNTKNIQHKVRKEIQRKKEIKIEQRHVEKKKKTQKNNLKHVHINLIILFIFYGAVNASRDCLRT